MSLPWALLCVCCVSTAPAAPRKLCSEAEQIPPQGWANWGGKALKFQYLGEKCTIFLFLKPRKCHFPPPSPDLFCLNPEAESQNSPNSRPGLGADQSCLLWLRLKAALKWKSIRNLQIAFQATPARAFAFQLFNKRHSHSGRFVSLSPGCVKKEILWLHKAPLLEEHTQDFFAWNLAN